MTEQFVAHRRAFGRLAAGALTVALVAAGSLTAAAAPAAPPTAPVVAGGGSHPVAAAFSPSGATAYVVDNSAFINVVATGTNTHTGTIFTSGPPPAPNGFLTGAAVSPDGKSLFAAANNTGNGCCVGVRIFEPFFRIMFDTCFYIFYTTTIRICAITLYRLRRYS